MTDWRPVTACAPSCRTCTHVVVEPQPRVDLVLCTEPRAITAFGRQRIAAGLVREELCGARWHQQGREGAKRATAQAGMGEGGDPGSASRENRGRIR